jgi:hypothetical protein
MYFESRRIKRWEAKKKERETWQFKKKEKEQ